VCRAIELALASVDAADRNVESERSMDDNVVFQIATEVETPINEGVKLVQELASESGLPRGEIRHAAEKRGEIRRSSASIANARAVLGFAPRIGLREGLRKVWSSWPEDDVEGSGRQE